MEIKIILNGVERAVTKHQLFALAARGTIGPDTTIFVDDKPYPAKKIKGIVFDTQTSSEASGGLYQVAENTPPEPVSSVPSMETDPFAAFTAAMSESSVHQTIPPRTSPPRSYSTPGASGTDERFIPAIIVGAIVAVVCSILWGIISAASGFQIGWMAWGVGLAVGCAMRVVGNGKTPIYGIFGAAFSVIACIAGNLLMCCIIAANTPDVGGDGTMLTLFSCIIGLIFRPHLILAILFETFAPIDLLFYGLALYVGFKAAFNEMKS